MAFGHGSSCSSNPSGTAASKIVVQAYLFAGQPVENILLTQPLGLLNTTDRLGPPVNTALVYLEKNGIRYNLILSPDQQGQYFYPGNDLTVAAGDVFNLGIAYEDQQLTATTIVPPKPDTVGLSADTLFLVDTRIDNSSNSSILISWSATAAQNFFHYILIENIDPLPSPFPEWQFLGNNPVDFSSFPFSAKQFLISAPNFTHSGKHLTTVYSINQEYADLFIDQAQPDGTVNQAQSNIRNGLGIFTAFNSSDSLHFYVKQILTP